MKKTILIVDSVDSKRNDLKELFQDKHTVLEAKNGDQAKLYVDDFRTHISLVIINFTLQRGGGLQIVDYMNKKNYIDQIPVIMLCDDDERMITDAEIESAIEMGVSDFISSPFHPTLIVRKCESVMGLYKEKIDTEYEIRKHGSKLTAEVENLKTTYQQIFKNHRLLIDALSSAVEFRELSVGTHIKRLKIITRILMNRILEMYPKYNLTSEDVDMIVEAVSLHDIGKVCVSDTILFKPSKLTDAEYEEVKNHTIYGCSLLEPFKQENDKFYQYCYDICRYHHERADGGGYPDQLVGDQIPIWAQAVSIADVFDALVSQRVYKEAYEVNLAISLIYTGDCGKFSDEIMSAFEASEKEIFATIDMV